MRRRWKILTAFAAVAAVTAVALLVTGDSEPRYQGRSLSHWLALYHKHATSQDSPEFKLSTEAVRTIGTNALPYLMKWIHQEPPFWQSAARSSLPQAFSRKAPASLLIDGSGYERAGEAMLGFGILGSNAACAIPDLKRIINNTTRSWTATRAVGALSSQGAPALPHMVAALSDTNQPYRDRIGFYLAVNMARDVGREACLPALRTALNDSDPEVRSTASRMLLFLTNAPSQ